MKIFFVTTMSLFSSLSIAHPQSSTWADLGLIERNQIIEAADYCDRQNGAVLSVVYTDVELDGSVGYQGVYNYIYTTKFAFLDKTGRAVSHVIVISQHDANIDDTPISYDFKIYSTSVNGVACEIP
jgi:hypothetical protein